MELGLTAPLPQLGQGYGLGVGVREEKGRSTVPGSVGDYFWGGATGPYFWVDPAGEARRGDDAAGGEHAAPHALSIAAAQSGVSGVGITPPTAAHGLRLSFISARNPRVTGYDDSSLVAERAATTFEAITYYSKLGRIEGGTAAVE